MLALVCVVEMTLLLVVSALPLLGVEPAELANANAELDGGLSAPRKLVNADKAGVAATTTALVVAVVLNVTGKLSETLL